MKSKLILFLLCGILLFSSQVFAESAETFDPNDLADLSYAFGMVLGSDLRQTGLLFDYDAFTRGFREVMENMDTRIPMDLADQLVELAIYQAMSSQAEINRQVEEAFLAQNAQRAGVFTTASGLQYEIIEEGSGEQPSENDFVKVHYIGFLIDGTVFDSSVERGDPENFPLEMVIPGWSEGIQLMRVGGKSRIFIPSSLAYGTRGVSGVIPPNAVIVFDVELLEIHEPPPRDLWDIEFSD